MPFPTTGPGEPNPYAAPSAEIGASTEVGPVDSEDEALRRAHLGHERSIRAIGLLSYLVAGIWILGGLTVFGAMVFFLLRMARFGALGQPTVVRRTVIGAGVGAGYLAVGVFLFLCARGLRRLLPWARWVWLVLASIAVVACLVVLVAASRDLGIGGGLAVFAAWVTFPAITLFLLLAPKGRVIFSPDYRAVVARTPHVRYVMSRRAKRVSVIALGILIGLGILGIALAAWYG